MKPVDRSSAGIVYYLNMLVGRSNGEDIGHRFDGSFFGGKPPRDKLGAIKPPRHCRPFVGTKNATKKPVAVTIYGTGNAPGIHDIQSHRSNHITPLFA